MIVLTGNGSKIGERGDIYPPPPYRVAVPILAHVKTHPAIGSKAISVIK